ncbi:hypothetical protein [Pedobacter agri]|uniref:hypothetical protein n=1 Tax=Pedobacter agri TaxID=454586 RepID=UPI00292CEB9A|nr:hypothetical protein [Pedobacter agri]
MKDKLTKHILIRLCISIVLLLLLHFSQIEYAINANLIGMGFHDNLALLFGSIILFVWVIYLVFEMVKFFKNKPKWFAISNIISIVLILLGYGFINILIAVSQC